MMMKAPEVCPHCNNGLTVQEEVRRFFIGENRTRFFDHDGHYNAEGNFVADGDFSQYPELRWVINKEYIEVDDMCNSCGEMIYHEEQISPASMTSFKEWQAQAQSIRTIDLPDAIRDCYIFPNGIHVMEDFITPRNVFKKSFSLVVMDYTVPMTTKIDHAEISPDYYTEEGFGVPVFRGEDAMEHAFNYAKGLYDYQRTN